MKYSVTVAFSLLQTIEVDADSKDEAMLTAWDLFDQDKAMLGEGEIVHVYSNEGEEK
jgi:hypothetical protein